MIDRVRRLLSPEYWVVVDPGPVGRLWVIYLMFGMFFVIALGTALRAIWGERRLARRSTIIDQRTRGEAPGRSTWDWIQ
jgi:hypothetical protein